MSTPLRPGGGGADNREAGAEATGVVCPARTVAQIDDAPLARNRAGDAPDEHVLAELATDLLIVIEPDGRLRYVNRAVTRILGRDPMEYVGRNVLELVHPDDVELASRALEGSSAATGVQDEPLRVRAAHADGSWRSIEIVANNLLDDRRVKGIVISARDVTERVRAERALRESEERFRRIVELATEGIWATDLEGNTTFVNPRMAELLGYTVDEMLGRPVQDFCGAEAAARVTAYMERGQPEPGDQHEFAFRRSDGSEVWTLVSATRLFDDHGTHSGMLALVADLTERRANETALRRAEAEFRALVSHSSDIITVLNADGSFRSSNEASRRVLGYPEGFEGGDIFSFVHPDDVDIAVQGFAQLTVGETPEVRVVRVRALDGGWRHLEVLARNLIDDPAVHGIVLNVRDVSDRVAAEAAARESHDRFQALVQHTSDMITVSNPEGILEYVSPSVTEMLGYTTEELEGTPARRLMHPDDLERVEETITAQLQSGEPGGLVQHRLRHRDGSYRIVEGVTTNLLDEPGIRGVVTNTRDITDRHAAEARARQLEEVLSKSNEFVLLSDNDGNVVWANQKARTWLRLTGDEHVSELAILESRERLRNDIVPFVHEHGLWTGELTLLTSTGEEIPVVATLQAHRQDGDIVLVSVIAHDITELKQIHHRLRYEATHDPLTGLPNRSLFRELGEQALARAGRHGTKTAVLFLDLDGFKVVNDTLGHSFGDTVLVELGARFRIGVRSGDVIARLGGDEFCVLCERVSGSDEAQELARRLVDVVSVPLAVGGQRIELGTSVGVAVDEGGAVTIEKLIRNADVALYEAKQAGRGQVACFARAYD